MAIAPPCIHRLLFISFIILRLRNQFAISHSLQQKQQPSPPEFLQSNKCGDKCGTFQIPFPFYINTSCGSISDDFRLSCQNSTSPYLSIDSQSYRILEFFSDGVLVDFPNTTTFNSCRVYSDLNAFGFKGNDYFGISSDNVVGLYDCEDSSLCKAECEKSSVMPTTGSGCDGNSTSGGGGYPACCYPLSDPTSWSVGDEFSVFSQFGCRGFSCWVNIPAGSTASKRGVKLEWAVPENSSKAACAADAYTVNTTSVPSGVRCQCPTGFVGDALAQGIGCLKSCLKDGREAYGKDCFKKGRGRREVEILAGVLTLAFSVASLGALFCLLKRPIKPNTFDPNQGHIQSDVSFQKACKTRLFAYHELEEATKGFDDGQKRIDGIKGTIYSGVLGDGSHVAVHKMHCESERDLIQVLSLVEVLSAVTHRNLARLLGCCMDNGYAPLVVYEYPVNGTLEEHLLQSRGQNTGFDWYKRLKVASETASVLAFLQYEISPPIFHHDLHSDYIFLDEDFSVKIAGFGLRRANPAGDGSRSHNYSNSEGLHFCRGEVYSLGVVLVEIITGSRLDLPTIALRKIRSGKLEEIVDPLLYYHEQPQFCREQIEIVADLATRCLLFGGDGKIGMIDVARELEHVAKDHSANSGSRRRGPSLEETFSNSSLLQMISMSPDSIYVPSTYPH